MCFSSPMGALVSTEALNFTDACDGRFAVWSHTSSVLVLQLSSLYIID